MTRARSKPAVSWGKPDAGSASGTRAGGGPRGIADFIGKYRVISEIGRGGMATVHLARIDGPGGFHRWVAIKRIHPHLVDNDQVVDMFLDEARMAAGISHANVAQVFDLGKDEHSYWIAMEYLHGEPLREIMRHLEADGAPMSPDLAARICADAAEGLHAAHEVRGKSGQLLGLVHRDVTPHNLIVGFDGSTKVVDFGIALAAERLSATLQHGQLKGKLAYMSPEQIRNDPVDRTTDVFALGIVLWELTTAQRLFRRDTDLDTLERAQACDVPLPSQLVPNYPPELERIVMRALARDRQHRFATAREMSRALQTFLMRRTGGYAGAEDVAVYVQRLFAERIADRDAHLAWAAEVTNTHDLHRGQPADPASYTPSGVSDSSSFDGAQTLARHDAPSRGSLPPEQVVREAESADDEEENIQTSALRLDDQELDDVRAGRRLASEVLARHREGQGAPSSRAMDPVAAQPPGEQLAAGSRFARTMRVQRPRTEPTAPSHESPGALVALFVATVASVLALALALRWLVSLF
ncbi:MAG: serine/threonine-protein kinase [Polyangiaceae bacterium]